MVETIVRLVEGVAITFGESVVDGDIAASISKNSGASGSRSKVSRMGVRLVPSFRV
jgi:hypothetical protein